MAQEGDSICTQAGATGFSNTFDGKVPRKTLEAKGGAPASHKVYIT